MKSNEFTNNSNIQAFASTLTNIAGMHVGTDHIHEGNGRFFYIQPTKAGAPMLLQHYRGPLFVDIHPDDLKALVNDSLSAKEYIASANWQIGYFWGGGSMIGGGFYQPFDIVNREESVKRYFKILSCRTAAHSSGYMPKEHECMECSVEDCPFSKFKEGYWEDEAVKEFDPRRAFFKSLMTRFEKTYPGYTLRGFLCNSKVPDNEILLTANFHISGQTPSFTAFASEELIRSLLMKEIVPRDWDDFASKFTFTISSKAGADVSANQKNIAAEFVADMEPALKQCFAKEAVLKSHRSVMDLFFSLINR